MLCDGVRHHPQGRRGLPALACLEVVEQTRRCVELAEGPMLAALPCGISPHPLRQTHELGNTPNAKLRHHAPAMNLDGLLDRTEVCGDLLVETAGDDMGQHLAFAGRERLQLRVRGFAFVPVLPIDRSHSRALVIADSS